MPLINATMRVGSSSEYKQAIADGVHRAMVEVLGLDQDDFFYTVHEKSSDDFQFDANYKGMFRSDKIVLLQFFFGVRPRDLKIKFYEAIADNLTKAPGLRREDILINIVEPAPENWWAFGRQAS